MNLDQAPGRFRLDAALAGLAVTFRGMTARPGEHNCECHWGSAEELAQLKLPDVELDPDLLRRTWWVHSLIDQDPAVPAYEVFALRAEASGMLSPWLRTWEALTHPMADQRLAEAVARWDDPHWPN